MCRVGWPEPYTYTVYDHIFGDFPANNTVYTPYMYGSDQPYVHYRVIGNFVLELPCTHHVFTKGSD